MGKEVGSTGKTNQYLPKINFTLDHHFLSSQPQVQALLDSHLNVKACPSLPLPINNHECLSESNITGICNHHILLDFQILNKHMSLHNLFSLCKECYILPTAEKQTPNDI